MSAVIKATENGPYLVKGLDSLTDAKGADLMPDQAAVALCRCGESNNKPFCDGSHQKIQFSSATEETGLGKWDDYVGAGITIHDNRQLCAHAGHCTQGLASVWRMGQTPWIDPDAADLESIIEVIKQCPSGALSYSIDRTPGDAEAAADAVLVSANGPYHVTGSIRLDDPSRNNDAMPNRYALCRCGASKNKPFCDGSHWDIKFKDD